jgi:hypothetical protein
MGNWKSAIIRTDAISVMITFACLRATGEDVSVCSDEDTRSSAYGCKQKPGWRVLKRAEPITAPFGPGLQKPDEEM